MNKVLIVDDSSFMRLVISDMVKSCPGFEVVGMARNGKEAVELSKELNPDVITLDIEMPLMDGLTALEIIMRTDPRPVIMMSTLTVSGADETLKALDLGAFDFIPKPLSAAKVLAPEVKEDLCRKLKAATKCNKLPKLQEPFIGKAAKTLKKSEKLSRKAPGSSQFSKIVAIATSTGGPRALQEVISTLPSNLDASVVVVQHMPAGFTRSLAERLDSISAVRVKEAEDGEKLSAHTVYIAPGDRHLKVEKTPGGYGIKLDDSARYNGHKPSADVMYDSIARMGIKNVVGVIMTGMGSDGAAGLRAIKKNGAFNISQDEKTSVVYGMPKAAVKIGVVDIVVGINNISEEIVKSLEV